MITDDLKARAEEIKATDEKTSKLLLQAAKEHELLREQFAAIGKRHGPAKSPALKPVSVEV